MRKGSVAEDWFLGMRRIVARIMMPQLDIGELLVRRVVQGLGICWEISIGVMKTTEVDLKA